MNKSGTGKAGFAALVIAACFLLGSGVLAAAETQGKLRVGQAQAQPFTFAQVGKVSEEIEGRVYEEIMPTFSKDGRFNPKALAVLSRSFVELGTLPSEPDMAKLYIEEFLPVTQRAAR